MTNFSIQSKSGKRFRININDAYAILDDISRNVFASKQAPWLQDWCDIITSSLDNDQNFLVGKWEINQSSGIIDPRTGKTTLIGYMNITKAPDGFNQDQAKKNYSSYYQTGKNIEKLTYAFMRKNLLSRKYTGKQLAIEIRQTLQKQEQYHPLVPLLTSALFGAETRRNRRTLIINFMILDLMENGIDDYSLSRVLSGTHPMAQGGSARQAKNTNLKGERPTSPRTELLEKQVISDWLQMVLEKNIVKTDRSVLISTLFSELAYSEKDNRKIQQYIRCLFKERLNSPACWESKKSLIRARKTYEESMTKTPKATPSLTRGSSFLAYSSKS